MVVIVRNICIQLLFCAKLARIVLSLKAFVCLFIIFSLQNLFLRSPAALLSTFLHITYYICTIGLHKNTTYSQAQAQDDHTVKAFKTNVGFSFRFRYVLQVFQTCYRTFPKLLCSFGNTSLVLSSISRTIVEILFRWTKHTT